jgi:hypothetical protein
MRLERGEGHPVGSVALAVAAALRIAPGMISLDGGPEADRDGEPVSLAGLRESLGLERSEVAAALPMPVGVLKRAEEGAAIGLGYAKQLSDFYGVRVTDWYPAAEERAAA